MKNLTIALVLLLINICLNNYSYATDSSDKNIDIEIDQELAIIIQEHEELYLKSSPFNQPDIVGNNAKLPDLSAGFLLAQYQQALAIYQQLVALDNEKLTQENQINLSVLVYSLQNQLDSYTNKEHYMPLTAESGFHVWIANISTQVDFKTYTDYQNYLTRLSSLPRYFDQQTHWMKLGLKSGISQPKIVLEGFEQSIAAFIKEDITKSSFYLPFANMSAFITPNQQSELQQQAKHILTIKVMPAYQAYYDFMVNEYQPNSRGNIAANSLPNGKAYYQNRLEHYTTLPMTAMQVHQQGLTEVKRIRAEMDEIIEQVNFEGSFSDFVQFLRTDPQFYASTPTELLKEASFIAKKMDAKLPTLFKKLPRTPYGVMAVPVNIAAKYTTGRYAGSSRDDQPGNY
jgi:uncharacterized protein (DUF885 family)